MIIDVEHFVLIGHVYILFGEMLIQVVCSFFSQVIFFVLFCFALFFNLFSIVDGYFNKIQCNYYQ